MRDSRVNLHVSLVSAVPAVRDLVSTRLRALAKERDVVMEGRDIGSAVFPETPYKFYLDACPEIRRQRRAAEGQSDEIEARDKMDSSRKTAPLKIAGDARVIDTSHLTLDGVVDAILGILRPAGLPPAMKICCQCKTGSTGVPPVKDPLLGLQSQRPNGRDARSP